MTTSQVPFNELRRVVQEAENTGNANLMAAILAEDITVIAPGSAVIKGKAAGVAFLQEWFAAFSIRIRYTPEAHMQEGGLAYEWATYQQETTARNGQQASETGRILWVYKQYGEQWLQHFVIWNTL